ncbi:hypothetical protein J2X55_003049 [Microbacterium sp. 1154]|uniref:hypothetical protein n=1 Tax=Microbacterium sp. 1154 TaxID=2817733 RepID=UPI0028548DCA|nr:hypothetical protein [Microbacterium sp. 1154]MDR6692111.1 hypothetical protein [Microbacterium sp. 1154]
MNSANHNLRASEVIDEIRSVALQRDVVAYTVDAVGHSPMFVNLPLGDPGIAYGWIGLWRNSADIAAGVPPHTVIASGAKGDGEKLRDLIERSHPHAHITESHQPDAVVVISTVDRMVSKLQPRRIADVGPLIERWSDVASA